MPIHSAYFILTDTEGRLIREISCAEPESFVRGVPTLTFFFVFISLKSEGTIQIPLLAGHQRPASETPFKWRFAGGPTMA